jgi:hypothetical protein
VSGIYFSMTVAQELNGKWDGQNALNLEIEGNVIYIEGHSDCQLSIKVKKNELIIKDEFGYGVYASKNEIHRYEILKLDRDSLVLRCLIPIANILEKKQKKVYRFARSIEK